MIMRVLKYFILQIVLVCLTLHSCQDVVEPVNNVPHLNTSPTVKVGVTTAYLTGNLYGGNYYYNGGYGGYYWDRCPGNKKFQISKTKNFANCIYVNASDVVGSYHSTYYAKVEGLDEGTTYYYKFIVDDYAIELEGTVEKFTTKKRGKAVDLGLSIKWADRNVGADSPEGYGDYFAWGEIYTKESYTEENSETYNLNIEDIAGHSKRDVAYADWGENWRLPSREECKELINKCTWTWTIQGGRNGYKVTGPNGKSIFLPAAGNRNSSTSIHELGERGVFWTSEPYPYNNDYKSAYLFGFIPRDDHVPQIYQDLRWTGVSVRPVCE